MKFIPKRLFQAAGFGSLIALIGLTAFWGINNTGWYRRIAGGLDFLDNPLFQHTAAALFTFFALFIPWFVVILIVREFTRDMVTMQDEIAYLKGEPRPPTLLDRPTEKAIFKGVVSLVVGVVLLVVDAIVWKTGDSICLRLWVAVPVAFVLGFYWLVSGLRQRV